ncbi:DUF4123 domain-containing protein [Pseudomonas syringae]
MSLYVLLERTDSLLEQLYRLLPAPEPCMLFDETELTNSRQASPVFLDADGQHPLLEAVSENPDDWPGLIIESASPVEVVLAHLRHILLVRFEGNRRGVLRYSHPVTASYFFTAETPQTSTQWLGPISRLRWYGGTWADIAQGDQHWISIDNPHASRWKPPYPLVTPGLSLRQEDALRLQNRESPQ